MNQTFVSPQLFQQTLPLTTSWQKIGTQIDMRGYTTLGLYLNLTINNSQDVQIKIVGRTSSTDVVEYLLPVYAVTVANKIEYYPTYFELGSDIDQNLIIQANTNNLIPFVDIYMQVGTLGATAAVVNNAYVGLAWSSTDRG